MTVEVTDENFAKLKDDAKVLMVDFGAEWCGPCQRLAPIVEELGNDYEGRVVIGRADIDECIDLSAQFRITSVPTVLFFKNGELRDRSVGLVPKEMLCEKIDALL